MGRVGTVPLVDIEHTFLVITKLVPVQPSVSACS